MSSPIHSGSGPSPVGECAADIATHSHSRDDAPIPDEGFSRGQSVVDDLLPPPPKPADEKVVRNIEVLCNFIAKNGPGFEEMARQKESGNPEFKFLFGGEPGSEASCAREYYLWMKQKCGLAYSSHEGEGHMTLPQRHVDVDPLARPNSLDIIRTTHSPVDSDVDMEDDITQSDKVPTVNSAEDRNPESVLTGDLLEIENQENMLQNSRDSLDVNFGQPVKSQAVVDAKHEECSDQAASIDSPFRLLQNYASDDSSEDDGQPSNEEVKAVRVSPHKPVVVRPEDVLKKDLDNSEAVKTGFQESLTKASSLGKSEVDDRTGTVEPSSPNDSFQEKYASERENRGVPQKEGKGNVASAVKIDEFGRLIKKGASDSESDDAYHSRRRGKRERSRSRSRSPSDRRRRRSPRRRKDRSRSPSWSPKKRRSRSRSPYRPGGDFGGEKLRRDKVQTRQCFDFLKGRCYRGASCRYLHHESGRIDSSRRYRSKDEHVEDISSSRNSDFRDGNVTSRLLNEVKGEKMDQHLDKHDGIDSTSKGYYDKNKEGSIDDALQTSVSHQGVDELENVQKFQPSREGHAQVLGVSEEPVSHLPMGEERPTSSTPSINEPTIHQSMAGASAQAHHRHDGDSQIMDNSTRSDSSAIQTNDTTALSNSTLDFSHQTSLLPPPPLPIQPTSTSQAPSHQVDNKLMPPPVSFLPQSVPESGPPYQAPLSNRQSHYPVPPNPSWSNIPPPPQPRPPYAGDLSMAGSLPFQPSNPPLRNDFPMQTSLPSHPQVGGFQHQTYPMHAQFPSQGSLPFGSFPPGNMPPLMPFQGDTNVKNMQSFQGSNPLPEPPKQTFQNQMFSQQVPLPFGPQLNATDSMSSYRDHPTRFLDIGGPRISAHYNPYASTFDKPLTSRFSATAFVQDRETATGSKYDSSSAVGNTLGEGQNTGVHGPRAGGQTFHISGGDQYDPLFDSMEPSSESFKKHPRKQGGHAADNSDILKLSSRYKVLDVEENNKQKEVGAVASANSLENDEFGETADAEVGAVENESPSDPDDDAIVAEGEIEIDQVKSEGKSKKSKDSRSMKLFKIAVANFVKEVLKPQWRQGNMSKEVFKTIVKKTVEKVSGAMKNRRVPKSQAKIDHYIDSQRRKLTQLVEGYVSKYKI